MIETCTPVRTGYCLSCAKAVKGRSDKKFCNDYCRNTYNNRKKNADVPLVKRINGILLKNRSILLGLFGPGEDTTRLSKSRMIEKGFSFRYFTNTYTNKNGMVYYFCYDYGYLLLENESVLAVKRKDEL
jgi:predicted nucleic acid-binding Zn ribbon protein